MRATTLEAATLPANARAMGYRLVANEYFEEPSLPHGAFGSIGGLLTSTQDLGRYVAFHLSALPPRGDKDHGPVLRSSVREMQTPLARMLADCRSLVARCATTSAVGSLRLRFGYLAGLPLLPHRRSRRRASRFWVIHDLAA
jgi:hypothetical protein